MDKCLQTKNTKHVVRFFPVLIALVINLTYSSIYSNDFVSSSQNTTEYNCSLIDDNRGNIVVCGRYGGLEIDKLLLHTMVCMVHVLSTIQL